MCSKAHKQDSIRASYERETIIAGITYGLLAQLGNAKVTATYQLNTLDVVPIQIRR